MKPSLPTAKSARSPDEREKIRRIVVARGLCGLANDTKWDEFIAAMRTQSWRPSYRFKCIDGPISGWDVEWYYHLPFPFSAVEWFDVGFIQKEQNHRLTPPTVTDHSEWIEAILAKVGLEYTKGQTTVRIFGYSSQEHGGLRHVKGTTNQPVEPTRYMSLRFCTGQFRATEPRRSKKSARPHPRVAHFL